MENSNPIEQMKGFAEKKLRVLRENPDESGTKAYLAKMRKGVGKVPGADPELWGILFEGSARGINRQRKYTWAGRTGIIYGIYTVCDPSAKSFS